MSSTTQSSFPQPFDLLFSFFFSISASSSTHWKRKVVYWREVTPKGPILEHAYAFSQKDKNREIYLDCRPVKIFTKCIVSLIVRPVFTVAKTLYHASLIEIPIQFLQVCRGKHSIKTALMNSVRSIADIVRTPLYGTALTIATLGAIVLSIYNPESLYESREILGRLEKEANWGTVKTSWTLASCFQPWTFEELQKKYSGGEQGTSLYFEDTIYDSDDPLEIALTNFVRAIIGHKREYCNLFDQVFDPMDNNMPFKSKVLQA